MSTTYPDTTSEYLQYRELSMGAVAALVLGIISFTALLFIKLAIIPLAGMVIGYRAIVQIRSRPEELAGIGIARVGVALSTLLFLCSIGWAVYDHATEVPPGYTRVKWSELQPDKSKPKLPVSPRSIELHNTTVFVEGYVYPDDTQNKLKTFIMVPDKGTCCFGGNPKLTDMIEVTLKDPLRVKYSWSQRKLGGILKVDTRKKPVSGLDGVYYQLEADYVK